MAPFDSLYERKCSGQVCWDNFNESVELVPDLVAQTADMVKLIRERFKVAQDRKK